MRAHDCYTSSNPTFYSLGWTLGLPSGGWPRPTIMVEGPTLGQRLDLTAQETLKDWPEWIERKPILVLQDLIDFMEVVHGQPCATDLIPSDVSAQILDTLVALRDSP